LRTVYRLDLKAADGQRVRAYLNTPAVGQFPSVVFAHGFGSNRSGEKALALEQECERRGWGFAACDFRSHGESEGTMLDLRAARLLEDLDLIVGAAADRGMDPVFLVGSSMGGWAAAWHALRSRRPVAACALVAPAFRFLEWRMLSQEERNRWRSSGRYRSSDGGAEVELSSGLLAEGEIFKVEELLSGCRTPLLIFHGMQDEVVPYTESVEFAAASCAPDLRLILFKSGDHRLNLFKQ
jgi:pimeloyl-ACP methyl ester carboxylesterase